MNQVHQSGWMSDGHCFYKLTSW